VGDARKQAWQQSARKSESGAHNVDTYATSVK
jgi:hypothetical protein